MHADTPKKAVDGCILHTKSYVNQSENGKYP